MKKLGISLAVAGLILTNFSFASFSDVTEDHWAYSAIDKMQSDGILSGYEDGTFKPNKNISLAEFATIFTKIFEVPENFSSNYFIDVAENHWAKGRIEAIRKYINPYYDSIGESLGFDGYSYMEGILPELEMTREAFIYAVCKIYGYDESLYIEGEEKEIFADYDNILFPKEMILAYKNGIIKGEVIDGEVYARPNRRITRAEASSIFRNLLKYEEKRISNDEQTIDMENALEIFFNNMKKCEVEGIKNSVYDTVDILTNEYFNISEENLTLLKKFFTEYFKRFSYEVVDAGYEGFNNGYVKVKIKGYNIEDKVNEFMQETLEDFDGSFLAGGLETFTNSILKSIKDKEIKVTVSEQVFYFVKDNGEWKIWFK